MRTARTGQIDLRAPNPAVLELGNPLVQCDLPLYLLVRDMLRQAQPRLPELRFTHREGVLLRAGFVEVGEIHLCADFRFPTLSALRAVLQILKRDFRWRQKRNQRLDYFSTIYWTHHRWTLCVYSKHDQFDDEPESSRFPLRERTRNRLRVEVRIRRDDIRRLGKRLNEATLDLTQAGDWFSSVYARAFDFYARRLRPDRVSESHDGCIPLYRLIGSHGGRPLWNRAKDE